MIAKLMTIQDRLTDANARSAHLYLQRQQLEYQLQQIQIERTKIDMALMKLDGEIELLNQLLQEKFDG